MNFSAWLRASYDFPFNWPTVMTDRGFHPLGTLAPPVILLLFTGLRAVKFEGLASYQISRGSASIFLPVSVLNDRQV